MTSRADRGACGNSLRVSTGVTATWLRVDGGSAAG